MEFKNILASHEKIGVKNSILVKRESGENQQFKSRATPVTVIKYTFDYFRNFKLKKPLRNWEGVKCKLLSPETCLLFFYNNYTIAVGDGEIK